LSVGWIRVAPPRDAKYSGAAAKLDCGFASLELRDGKIAASPVGFSIEQETVSIHHDCLIAKTSVGNPLKTVLRSKRIPIFSAATAVRDHAFGELKLPRVQSR